MRYASILILVLVALPMGCKKKTEPEVADKPVLPETGRTIAPLPEPERTLAPRPRPEARPIPPAPEPEPELEPVPADRTYVVKKGDTLWGIATRELGAGKRWTEIPAINPGLKPEALKPGQTLKLPPK